VADALSRTIFPDENCASDDVIDSLGDIQEVDGQPVWFGRMERAATRSFCGIRKEEHNVRRKKEEDEGKLDMMEVSLMRASVEVASVSILGDKWCSNVYKYLTSQTFPPHLDKLAQRRIVQESRKHTLIGDDLFILQRGDRKQRCIRKTKVAEVLRTVHNQGGHHGKDLTM
jgi:hypothetical protein